MKICVWPPLAKCFHSFFEFSQTSVSVPNRNTENMFPTSISKLRSKKEKTLLTLIIKM